MLGIRPVVHPALCNKTTASAIYWGRRQLKVHVEVILHVRMDYWNVILPRQFGYLPFCTITITNQNVLSQCVGLSAVDLFLHCLQQFRRQVQPAVAQSPCRLGLLLNSWGSTGTSTSSTWIISTLISLFPSYDFVFIIIYPLTTIHEAVHLVLYPFLTNVHRVSTYIVVL